MKAKTPMTTPHEVYEYAMGHVHRRPKKKDFERKTIRRFILQADNLWKFEFTDGSKLAIQSDSFGQYGIACMALCEECGQ